MRLRKGKGAETPKPASEMAAGFKTEVDEVMCVSGNVDLLIFLLKYSLRPEDADMLEQRLSEKTGKKCVVVDARVGQIIGIEFNSTRAKQSNYRDDDCGHR